MCGDLNVAPTDRDVHPKERKLNAIGQRPDERALLATLVGEGLVDVGRALDPDNDDLFTYWAPWRQLRERNIGWRIDFVLASDGAREDGHGRPRLPRVRHERPRPARRRRSADAG